MSKLHIIITIFIAALLTAALCALGFNSKEIVTDEWAFLNGEEDGGYFYSDSHDSEEEEPDANVALPDELTALLPGAKWSVDTICTVGSTTYMHVSDYDQRIFAICTEHKLLAQDPSLTSLDTRKDTPTVKKVMAGEKTLIVDFNDPLSVQQLRTLSSPVLPGWRRHRWDYAAEFCDRVMNNLEIDYPNSSITNCGHIYRWVSTMALTLRNGPVAVPASESPFLCLEWEDFSGYQGSLENCHDVAAFIRDRYFADVRDGYGPKDEDIPASLYSIISLRARFFNDRYVTYQLWTNGYDGGLHGYYTDQLASYDCVHHKSIGWEYLFKPHTQRAVLRQLEMMAKADEWYQEWGAYIWSFIRQVDEDGNATGELLLPTPSLTPDGVVFSFQPYEIACFAAGCFHFTIPYSRLLPYLTDRAKWCIGLK